MRRPAILLALILPLLVSVTAFAAEHESQLNAEYWWDQFVKLFNLALLVGLLFFLLRKPVKNFFSERARQIDESLDSAKQAREEAQQRLKEVEERIAGLEQRMAEILAKARQEGEAEKERIIAAAESEAERILELAKHEIENRSKATRKELKTFTVDEAIEHARKLLRERLGPEKDEHLIDLFLDDLGGGRPQ